MNWFTENAKVVEATAAMITAIVAVVALFGVKFQLDENDRLQRAASARDAYRSHLALATNHPGYAAPLDGCALIRSDQAGAYGAFVDHLLYSAEQMLTVEQGWESVFLDHLDDHALLMCSEFAPTGDTPEITSLLQNYRQTACPAELTCAH